MIHYNLIQLQLDSLQLDSLQFDSVTTWFITTWFMKNITPSKEQPQTFLIFFHSKYTSCRLRVMIRRVLIWLINTKCGLRSYKTAPWRSIYRSSLDSFIVSHCIQPFSKRIVILQDLSYYPFLLKFGPVNTNQHLFVCVQTSRL